MSKDPLQFKKGQDLNDFASPTYTVLLNCGKQPLTLFGRENLKHFYQVSRSWLICVKFNLNVNRYVKEKSSTQSSQQISYRIQFFQFWSYTIFSLINFGYHFVSNGEAPLGLDGMAPSQNVWRHPPPPPTPHTHPPPHLRHKAAHTVYYINTPETCRVSLHGGVRRQSWAP